MTVDRADLAGDVETRNGFLHGVQDALFSIVLRAALSIVDNGPSLNDIEGWSGDGHHGLRRAPEVFILPFAAKRIPPLHAGFENFRIHINLPGNILNTITLFNPALTDLAHIVVAPLGV